MKTLTKPFEVVTRCSESKARTGRLQTPHGVVDTPVFAPVGTQGSVKSLLSQDLEKLQIQLILANTYHLYLRPGIDVIARAGGLHQFMSWNGAILTDSGGYQVFSHRGRAKITEDGVEFQSHVDGARHACCEEREIRGDHHTRRQGIHRRERRDLRRTRGPKG